MIETYKLSFDSSPVLTASERKRYAAEAEFLRRKIFSLRRKVEPETNNAPRPSARDLKRLQEAEDQLAVVKERLSRQAIIIPRLSRRTSASHQLLQPRAEIPNVRASVSNDEGEPSAQTSSPQGLSADKKVLEKVRRGVGVAAGIAAAAVPLMGAESAIPIVEQVGEEVTKGEEVSEIVVDGKSINLRSLRKGIVKNGENFFIFDKLNEFSPLIEVSQDDEEGLLNALGIIHSAPVVRLNSQANLRSEANVSSKVVERLEQGSESRFTVLELVGGWAKVRLSDGREGYIATSSAGGALQVLSEGGLEIPMSALLPDFDLSRMKVFTVGELSDAATAAGMDNAMQRIVEDYPQPNTPEAEEVLDRVHGIIVDEHQRLIAVDIHGHEVMRWTQSMGWVVEMYASPTMKIHVDASMIASTTPSDAHPNDVAPKRIVSVERNKKVPEDAHEVDLRDESMKDWAMKYRGSTEPNTAEEAFGEPDNIAFAMYGMLIHKRPVTREEIKEIERRYYDTNEVMTFQLKDGRVWDLRSGLYLFVGGSPENEQSWKGGRSGGVFENPIRLGSDGSMSIVAAPHGNGSWAVFMTYMDELVSLLRSNGVKDPGAINYYAMILYPDAHGKHKAFPPYNFLFEKWLPNSPVAMNN